MCYVCCVMYVMNCIKTMQAAGGGPHPAGVLVTDAERLGEFSNVRTVTLPRGPCDDAPFTCRLGFILHDRPCPLNTVIFALC